jgi:putative aldouronate transport system substrate-binding protein
MRRNTRRLMCRLGLLAVMLIVITFGLSAAGGQQATATRDLSSIGFRASGFPIVTQPVEMHAMIARSPVYPVPFAQMTLLQELQQRTGVTIRWEEVPAAQIAERTNLVFASRDFSDVFFQAGVSDRALYEAALGGDVYALNSYIRSYAPNWTRAFQEAPLMEKAITMADGNIYALPYYRDIVNDYLIRDIQTINTDWLALVGKSIPRTTEEFYDVLKAFRNGIDSGLLPANAVPYNYAFHAWANGGEYEIYGAFGIWMKDTTYLSVNNGRAEFGAIDRKLIDAVEFLHRLYSERLIVEEMFTQTGGEYQAQIMANPPLVGGYGLYFLHDHRDVHFDPLPPLRAPGVQTPIFRSQPVRLQKNQFAVMTKFPFPEVAVRFIDNMADELTAIQMSFGRIGHELIDNGDGTFTAAAGEQQYLQHSPHNNIAAFISRGISDRVIWQGDQGRRDQIAREVFGPYVWPQERHYPPVILTEREQEDLSVLQTEIQDYVRTSIANWIVNGGVRQAWNTYLADLDRLGLPRMMAIRQAALDRFLGN